METKTKHKASLTVYDLDKNKTEIITWLKSVIISIKKDSKQYAKIAKFKLMK